MKVFLPLAQPADATLLAMVGISSGRRVEQLAVQAKSIPKHFFAPRVGALFRNWLLKAACQTLELGDLMLLEVCMFSIHVLVVTEAAVKISLTARNENGSPSNVVLTFLQCLATGTRTRGDFGWDARGGGSVVVPRMENLDLCGSRIGRHRIPA
jgi:hypothetical protein